MRTTTTRKTPTRMAKNGAARGKYCIWPMVILKAQGGGKNRLHGRTTRTCPAGSAFARRPYPASGEGRVGRLIARAAWAKAETSTVRRQSKLEGRLCPAMEDYRNPALILSSTAEPGHNSLSESALSGVSVVLRC